MSRSAGIGRDLVGLLAAQARHPRAGRRRPAATADRWSVETANLALAASALLAAAEARAESRGCHVRNDHPDKASSWERSVLVRQVDGGIRTDVADLRPAVAWA